MRAAWVVAGCLGVTAAAGPAAPQQGYALAELSWMSGTWRSEAGGVTSEELWTGPEGGVMLGLHRDVRPGRPASWEFLRIEDGPGSVVYHASPGGAAPTPFTLVELGAGRAVFANPDHDFPKRIVYWVEEEGTLNARADAGEGTDGPEWRWRRVN